MTPWTRVGVGMMLAGLLAIGCADPGPGPAAQAGALEGEAIPHPDACEAPKVAVCHVPPGNPDNRHLICISDNAVDAHVTHHGDEVAEAELCEDGVDNDCDGLADGADPDCHDGCPADAPEPWAACAGSATCEFGTETCCGETYPSLVCSCSESQWACYYTDACLVPSCDDGEEGEE